MSIKKKMQKKAVKEILIKFYIPDDVITRYTTNITVQKLENEVVVRFFELKPELCFDEKERSREKEVRADCVASVIVTTDRLPRFIKILQNQLSESKGE